LTRAAFVRILRERREDIEIPPFVSAGFNRWWVIHTLPVQADISEDMFSILAISLSTKWTGRFWMK